MKKLTACRTLYALFLLGLVALFGFQLRSDWLQSDLQALLPESDWSAVQQQADARQSEQFSRQVIALVGHREPQHAFALAEQTAESWQTSGLFSQINHKISPNLPQLRAQLRLLSVATLPETVREQLLNSPQTYFQQYAEQLLNPFQQTNLLPLAQDWLGFGRFAALSSQPSALQWHAESGMLFRTVGEQTWVLLQGELKQAEFIHASTALPSLLAEQKTAIEQGGGQLLTVGSALFSAHAQQQAEGESLWMSVSGVSLTLLLLLVAFRTARVLWLFLPIAVGMLCGVAATVVWFGQIHILTLVIGTSLIGVLIDFPLHWLSSSLFQRQWHAERAMAKLKFTFLISLFVTLLGYILLSFTPLPVLKQTALFSAVALVAAVLATGLFLPLLLRRGGRSLSLEKIRASTGSALTWRGWRWGIGGIILLLGLMGIVKTHWQDDIRQWVALPQPLLDQAQQISHITGIDSGSQYLLLTADNDENLLNKDKTLTEQLLNWQQQGKIHSFQSLSQWIISETAQRHFAEQLSQQIQPNDYALLAEIGIEPQQIEKVLSELKTAPTVSLQQALQTDIGQAWRSLYLGELDGKVAAMIKLSGLQNSAEIAPLANGTDIFWQDKRASLNQAFEQSRNQAAWLKLLSFALAGLLLWRFFGVRQTAKMLIVPLGAIAATLAIFGWLGVPISLFVMFGLLLVSAIAIDYTAYMHTADEPLPAKRTAITLAAATTLISFLLLSLSSTPAVAGFGLSVSVGVVLSVLITFKMFK